MTKQDRKEFILYLKGLTDAQVRGVYEKEKAAGRRAYTTLAREEMFNRRMA